MCLINILASATSLGEWAEHDHWIVILSEVLLVVTSAVLCNARKHLRHKCLHFKKAGKTTIPEVQQDYLFSVVQYMQL